MFNNNFYGKILTWSLGFRVKITVSLILHCLAISKRDQLEHKENRENQTNRKMTRKPRSPVKILVYRMWGIDQTRKRKRRTCTPSFTCILCINFHVVYILPTDTTGGWGAGFFNYKRLALGIQGWPAVDDKPFFFLSNFLCYFSRC